VIATETFGAQVAEIPVRGCHVVPQPNTTFYIESRFVPSSEGPIKVVTIRLEHSAGSTELVVPADFAHNLARALIKASTGIEIAGGTNG
jgi:hypothetical protein